MRSGAGGLADFGFVADGDLNSFVAQKDCGGSESPPVSGKVSFWVVFTG